MHTVFSDNDQVGDNIIAMYPPTSLFIAIGQLAIVILVLFSYPLQVLPCRNCLDKVFHMGLIDTVVKPDDDGEVDALSGEDEPPHVDMSPLKHAVLTSLIIAFGFTIAYLVDDLRIGKFKTVSI